MLIFKLQFYILRPVKNEIVVYPFKCNGKICLLPTTSVTSHFMMLLAIATKAINVVLDGVNISSAPQTVKPTAP